MNERGVVISILKINFDTNILTYGNVGNINTYLITEQEGIQRLFPMPGYLSGRKFAENVLKASYQTGLTFLLHSDGAIFSQLDEDWFKQSFSLNEVMEKLISNMESHDDDLTVIVGRINDEPTK